MNQKQTSWISGIHHVSLETDNWEESLAFYRDFLGLKPGAKGSGEKRRLQLLDAGDGVCLELTELTQARPAPAAEQQPRLTHIAFRVTDTAGLMAAVKDAGYEVTLDTRTIHSGDLHAVIGFFKGPQGELIEAFQVLSADTETA